VFYKYSGERTGILEATGNRVVILARTGVTSNTGKDELLVELPKECSTPVTEP
jgi:hypothetical protein